MRLYQVTQAFIQLSLETLRDGEHTATLKNQAL